MIAIPKTPAVFVIDEKLYRKILNYRLYRMVTFQIVATICRSSQNS
jgi:hypothetical protein